MWKNKSSVHLQKGLEDDKERWMDEMEERDSVEDRQGNKKGGGGLNDEVCSV